MQERTQKERRSVFIRLAVLVIPIALLLLAAQTAFAQNTYVIKDGSRVVYHTSYTSDPAEVLTEAGLTLGADDTYTTVAALGVSEINVQRSQTVTVDNCGKLLQVVSRGETVEEMLARLSIPTNGNTSVSVPLKEKTYDGMVLTISRTMRVVETYTTTMPHDTVIGYDDSIPAGQTVVVTPGVDGQMSCTASVVYVDGEEMSRTLLSSAVVQQPVSEVLAVGTGTGEAPANPSVLEIGDGYILTASGERLTFSGTMKVQATAYTHTDPGCNEITATGTVVRVGTVAVDPAMIPYGTRMFIVSDDGKYIYGIATAEDCGGAIKQNRVDLYFPTTQECLDFGRRNCTIYILGDSEILPES